MRLLVLIFCLTYLTGTAKNAQLTGCITNPVNDSIEIEWLNISSNDLEVATAFLDKKGCFKLSFEAPSQISKIILTHGNEMTSCYLAPGDSMHMTVNYKKFDETIQYFGKNAAYSNYLAAYFLKFNDSDNPAKNLNSYYQMAIRSLEPIAYLKTMDSIQLAQEVFIDDWKQKLPAEYFNYERNIIAFETARQKGMYFGLRGFFAKQNPKITVPEMPKDYENYLTELRWDKAYLSHEYAYQETAFQLANNIVKNTHPTTERTSPVYSLIMLKTIDSISKPTINERLSFYYLADLYEDNRSLQAEEAYQYFLKSSASDSLIGAITAMKVRAEMLQPGKKAPDFLVEDVDGKTRTLADYAGKIVVIDFWASWCGPCIAEFPHAPKVKEALPSDQFVFLYISIDESKDVWKKSAQKFVPDAEHLWSAGAFNSLVAKDYQVRGIPRYVVIDANGFLVTLEPPRPSSGKLPEYLLSLLKQ